MVRAAAEVQNTGSTTAAKADAEPVSPAVGFDPLQALRQLLEELHRLRQARDVTAATKKPELHKVGLLPYPNHCSCASLYPLSTPLQCCLLVAASGHTSTLWCVRSPIRTRVPPIRTEVDVLFGVRDRGSMGTDGRWAVTDPRIEGRSLSGKKNHCA